MHLVFNSIIISLISLLPAIICYLLYISIDPLSLQDEHGNKISSGPRGIPILGSFPFLTKYPELTLNRWAKSFGSLYSIYLGNQLFMIISDPVVAKDLIVNNGSTFSGRKEMFIKSQIVFAGRGITATPYNDTWRKHRRIAFKWLNQNAVDSYTDVLDREASVLLKSLWDESKKGRLPINPQVLGLSCSPHAGRCSLNNMLTITFGTRTDSIHDSLVQTALRLSRAFMNCTGPMSNLVDFIPLLQRLPLPIIHRAKNLHNDLVETYGGLIKMVEGDMASGIDVKDCLAKTMLEIRDEEQLDHLDMAILASAFMIGGVETTAAVMQWFSALIPAYPDIQQKSHEELDRVVGRDRLPTIEDEPNLPYCHAIVKEVERCYNPFWLGTPHTVTSNFVYQGKFIPKDTVMVLNTWTMHHDENRFKNPEIFDPERYLNDSLTSSQSSNLSDPSQRDHWMFGAGRRICPGILVAEREIWLTISRMLWAFQMSEVPGQKIDLKEYDGKSGRSPLPFQIMIQARGESVVKILEGIEG
ncbi:cytochrome P450 [Mollisia scopiformis]|uniref:Cytochrome P450 n=1 Tax=Mollisia scopiformis TaxID=149040 RepID=A0A194X6N9_MOLSC|nr:cytochrome P450 [Mollisia scopiformis]KUJ15845.1 cytochrome P450 [Mollisia scopiformis]